MPPQPNRANRARQLWRQKAAEWDQMIGIEGDPNRRLQSDPVLMRMLGPVKGLDLLDAGCGNGYLSIRLAHLGARVSGVDWSPEIVEIARRHTAKEAADVFLDVASCSEMQLFEDASFDRIVSNYVLMDLPDLEGTLREFHRVLRPGGRVVLIFLHPCFEVPQGPERLDDGSVRYHWPTSYFEQHLQEVRWGSFRSAFITYHRSLSDYWRCFRQQGFTILDFEEPVVAESATSESPERIERLRMTPYSVAFLLEKPASRAD